MNSNKRRGYMTSKKQLNRQLLERAGFKNVPCSAPGSPCEGGDWISPDGKKRFYGISDLPHLYESVDLCLKYLAPQLFRQDLDFKLYTDNGYYFCRISQRFVGKNETIVADSIVGTTDPAAAFFMAMKVLMDTESRKSKSGRYPAFKYPKITLKE